PNFTSGKVVNDGTIIASNGTAIDLVFATDAITTVVSGGSIVGKIIGNNINDTLDFALSSGATFTYGSLISAFSATDLNSGTLELTSGGVISGALTFSGMATLRLDSGTAQMAGDVSGMGSGDFIDLRFQSFSAGDTVSFSQGTGSGTLSLVNSGGTAID